MTSWALWMVECIQKSGEWDTFEWIQFTSIDRGNEETDECNIVTIIPRDDVVAWCKNELVSVSTRRVPFAFLHTHLIPFLKFQNQHRKRDSMKTARSENGYESYDSWA